LRYKSEFFAFAFLVVIPAGNLLLRWRHRSIGVATSDSGKVVEIHAGSRFPAGMTTGKAKTDAKNPNPLAIRNL
jgi:hypothetical protein